MKTWDYLEDLRKAESKKAGKPCTDYRLAKLLSVRQTAMVNYRQGREMDDEVALRVAAALGLPPILVISDVRAARATAEGNADMSRTWEDVGAWARLSAAQLNRKKMVGRDRFELSTNWLKASCSTG